nr:uncharacterized protein LOC128675765 [Plodia interpunctella]
MCGISNEYEEEQDAISSLPLEMSWKIFLYLDDISLMRAGEACKSWRRIILSHCILKKRLDDIELVMEMGLESLENSREMMVWAKFRKKFLAARKIALRSKSMINLKRNGDDLVVCTKRCK